MTDAPPLNCDELVVLVTDYFEGALPAPDHARFEEHLEECPGCVIYVDQMRLTMTALGQLCEEDVPSDARVTLLTAFRDWKART
jgi:anti-sigma factor RsiW